MTTQKKKKHGIGAFIIAGISFIPLIGVIPGIISILNALITRRPNSKLLGILGFCGILLSVILYGVILPNALQSTGFSKLFESHAVNAMTSLVKKIEYIKLQDGTYPDSMEKIRARLQKGEVALTYDASNASIDGVTTRNFYYEVIDNGDHYLLFSVGPDTQPFTEDDIYPAIDPAKDKNIGWVQSKSM